MMQRNVSLKHLNTFGIDVRAAQYVSCMNFLDLNISIRQAEHPVWILGGGSNVLFIDDLEFCVLKNDIRGIDVVHEDSDKATIRVGGGVVWHDLVTWCVDHDLGGIENLALIPGTVGAAPIQNIGAYGVELAETFFGLRALNLQTGYIEEFTAAKCAFGYRDSVFKGELKGKYCIVTVDLRLTKGMHQLNTSYGAIRDILEKQGVADPGIRNIYDAVIAIRRAKLPDPAVLGNSGSFFKNPVVEESVFQVLRAERPEMPVFVIDEHQYKIPAGWLIEQCGWKGKRVGNVGCYEKQALVIVNYGGASGREVYDHGIRVRESVKERFGIDLSMEVNVLPQIGRRLLYGLGREPKV